MVKKIIIGISGADKKSGCTHTALTMANFLKNRSLKVALVECNDSGDFNEILDSSGQNLRDGNYFCYNNVDYYPFVNNYILTSILAKPYQFVILDFGCFKTCDKVLFSRSDVKIIVCGSKPWEVTALNNIFESIDGNTLPYYNFYFTFAAGTKQTMQDIVSGMGDLKNIFFPEYTENPFVQESFPGVEKMLGDMFEIKEAEPIKKKEPMRFNRRKLQDNPPDISAERNMKERLSTPAKWEETESRFISPLENYVPAEAIENKQNSSDFNRKTVTEPDEKLQDIGKIETTPNAVAVATLLEEEPSSKTKKKGFRISDILPGKKKESDYIEMEEETTVIKNLSYTMSATKELLSTSKELIKQVRNLPDSFTEKKLLSTMSFRIFQNAFCASLRAGELHKRTSSIDGYPALCININNQDIVCNEDIITKIIGEDSKAIIIPYEDDYTEI